MLCTEIIIVLCQKNQKIWVMEEKHPNLRKKKQNFVKVKAFNEVCSPSMSHIIEPILSENFVQ